MDKISLVREFWNEAPCDGQPNYALRSRFRYKKDAWLIPILEGIAANHCNILEIGCGQGTDGITLCSLLRSGSRYIGVDISEVSLASARAAAAELGTALPITPVFRVENAEHLSFPDNCFDCVVSVGALHHSDSTERAIAEARRVLAPGGSAFVFLYRTVSPRLLLAHALRALQAALDAVFRTNRVLYRWARTLGVGDRWGTAIYECFGVPILRSYTRRGMQKQFRDFASVRLTSHGPSIFTRGAPRRHWSLTAEILGYLWLAEAVKR